ncbi:MAG: nucleoside monophosphate kinase [Peptococcaceae bacterium]|nr:nucleoside monophosphate kinase [Peptococcaceae bacterium]
MTNNVSEYVYWAALHKIWETMHNSGRIMRQLQTVTTGEVLWKASALQLAEAFPTLPAEYCQSLIAARRQYDLHKIEAYLTEHHIHMVLHNDPAYPAFLKEIHQPPAILYYKGNFIKEPLQIAMVGSRKADRYGLDVAERIASQFSMANVPVVSGLAKGVDAAAHKGAILYQGGTIAVQGCGIDRVYPRENKNLAEEILAHPKGCIVTEFPIARAQNNEIGKIIREKQDKGLLVDDEIVLNLLKDRLNKSDCNNGYILDGFPRNVEQAVAYEKILNELNKDLGVVILLEVDKELAKKRITGRLNCPKCKAVFNELFENMKPAQEGICSHCGTELIKRSDDNEETFEQRYLTYLEKTHPLVEYYENKGNLFRVDSNTKDEATKDIENIIND